MDTINLVFCGLGGQGILFMTRVLAETFQTKGFNVIGAETHGMAQRGGSVISHLRIGDSESSLVRTGSAHFLFALDENEGYRNLAYLSTGSGMFVNSEGSSFPIAAVKEHLDKREVQYHSMPASKAAMDLGSPQSFNLALLGYFSVFSDGFITREELEATIGNISPGHFKEVNLKVLEAGYQAGMTENGNR